MAVSRNIDEVTVSAFIDSDDKFVSVFVRTPLPDYPGLQEENISACREEVVSFPFDDLPGLIALLQKLLLEGKE